VLGQSKSNVNVGVGTMIKGGGGFSAVKLPQHVQNSMWHRNEKFEKTFGEEGASCGEMPAHEVLVPESPVIKKFCVCRSYSGEEREKKGEVRIQERTTFFKKHGID